MHTYTIPSGRRRMTNLGLLMTGEMNGRLVTAPCHLVPLPSQSQQGSNDCCFKWSNRLQDSAITADIILFPCSSSDSLQPTSSFNHLRFPPPSCACCAKPCTHAPCSLTHSSPPTITHSRVPWSTLAHSHHEPHALLRASGSDRVLGL